MAPNQGGGLPTLERCPPEWKGQRGLWRRWGQQGAKGPPGRKGPAFWTPRPPCGKNPTEGVHSGRFCAQSGFPHQTAHSDESLARVLTHILDSRGRPDETTLPPRCTRSSTCTPVEHCAWCPECRQPAQDPGCTLTGQPEGPSPNPNNDG